MEKTYTLDLTANEIALIMSALAESKLGNLMGENICAKQGNLAGVQISHRMHTEIETLAQLIIARHGSDPNVNGAMLHLASQLVLAIN